jgi:hypothetical protein
MTDTYFYDNIDKLIGDDLLTNDDIFVKVEDLFINDVEFDINPELLKDDYILILYILCIQKMSTIKQEILIRNNIKQFFDFYKQKDITGGGNIFLLKDIKQYIKNKVLLITPKYPE